MPPDLSDVASNKARLAALTRHRGPHDSEVIEARRVLRESRTLDYIRQLADEAPPFTAEQRLRIAAILCSPAGAGEGS